GDNDHERAAIHHAKILRLFGRHVERLEQAFREGASVPSRLASRPARCPSTSVQAGESQPIQNGTERLLASALALPTEKAYRQGETERPPPSSRENLRWCVGP